VEWPAAQRRRQRKSGKWRGRKPRFREFSPAQDNTRRRGKRGVPSPVRKSQIVIGHWTSVILNRGKALILPHDYKRPVYPAPVRVFPLRRDLSGPGVYRVRRIIHQRGSPPHGGGNGLGIQRFHTGLRDFRDSERVAWRHDWPQESADANCLMVVGIHHGHRNCMELRFPADFSVPVRGRRSRRIPQHLTKLLAMVPRQRTGPRPRNHLYGNSTGRRPRAAAGGGTDRYGRMARKFLDFRLYRVLLGVRLVEVVPRRSRQASLGGSGGAATHSKRTRRGVGSSQARMALTVEP